MRTPQWKHQAIEYAHRMDPARAWFWQPRTGKTKMAIDNACYLAQAQEITGVIIVAPNFVHTNWLDRELPRHHWDDVNYSAYAWRSTNPENNSLVQAFIEKPSDLAWFAINQDALILERCQNTIARFLKARKSVAIFYDESHHFSVPGARRTAIARGLARLCAYRRTLTGTPAENRPLQLFSQFELLEKAALGHKTFTEFKDTYAKIEQTSTKGGRRFPRVVGYRNLDQLKERIAPYTSVVLRRDCEDLPPIQEEIRPVEWSPTLKKHWKECKAKAADFFLARGARSIAEGGAALTKLQQIEGGFWKQDDRIEPLARPEDNPKLRALVEEVEQHDAQVLIWAVYRHEIDAIANVLGRDAVRMYGGDKDRPTSIRQFRGGNVKCLIGHPMAVGEGQDFSTATKLIWYSQTPDAVLKSQANERATAVGKGSVQIVHLITPGGVDEYYRKLTDRKSVLADEMSREGLIEILERMNAE
jgi:hypothetical protein